MAKNNAKVTKKFGALQIIVEPHLLNVETLSPPYSSVCVSRLVVDSSTARPGRHHGRPGKWENRGLLGSSLDRVLDNDASLMLTTVWKRGKPAKMAVRAQENRACGAKKGALRAPPGALSDDHVGAPTPPWGSPPPGHDRSRASVLRTRGDVVTHRKCGLYL